MVLKSLGFIAESQVWSIKHFTSFPEVYNYFSLDASRHRYLRMWQVMNTSNIYKNYFCLSNEYHDSEKYLTFVSFCILRFFRIIWYRIWIWLKIYFYGHNFPLLNKTSKMVWHICLGFEKSNEERLLRSAVFFRGTGGCRFREHCPLIFLEMGLANVYITLSFSDPSLSGFRQGLRSHLRKLMYPNLVLARC